MREKIWPDTSLHTKSSQRTISVLPQKILHACEAGSVEPRTMLTGGGEYYTEADNDGDSDNNSNDGASDNRSDRHSSDEACFEAPPASSTGPTSDRPHSSTGPTSDRPRTAAPASTRQTKDDCADDGGPLLSFKGDNGGDARWEALMQTCLVESIRAPDGKHIDMFTDGRGTKGPTRKAVAEKIAKHLNTYETELFHNNCTPKTVMTQWDTARTEAQKLAMHKSVSKSREPLLREIVHQTERRQDAATKRQTAKTNVQALGSRTLSARTPPQQAQVQWRRKRKHDSNGRLLIPQETHTSEDERERQRERERARQEHEDGGGGGSAQGRRRAQVERLDDESNQNSPQRDIEQARKQRKPSGVMEKMQTELDFQQKIVDQLSSAQSNAGFTYAYSDVSTAGDLLQQCLEHVSPNAPAAELLTLEAHLYKCMQSKPSGLAYTVGQLRKKTASTHPITTLLRIAQFFEENPAQTRWHALQTFAENTE